MLFEVLIALRARLFKIDGRVRGGGGGMRFRVLELKNAEHYACLTG